MSDAPLRVTGLAVPWNDISDVREGGMRLQLAKPGPDLSRPLDVHILWQHDSGTPLARTKNGTARVWSDADGVRMEAALVRTTAGKDAYEAVRSGLLDGLSVLLIFPEDDSGIEWITDSSDAPIMKLSKWGIGEISLVTHPALKRTNIRALRAAEMKSPQSTLSNAEARRQLGALMGNRLSVAAANAKLLATL